MHIVHVSIRVKPEFIDAFIAATIANAQGSLQEAGVLRFDFSQNKDDPTHFMLYEVYREPEAVELHRATAHYLTWRDTVTDMMPEPRVGTKFQNIYPTDADWKA